MLSEESKLPVVVEVTVPHPYVVEVTFADGIRRRLDLESELWGEMFEPLRDPAVFCQAASIPS